MSHVVYTLRDSTGVPLYIGSTASLRTRLNGHHSKPWWAQVASFDYVTFPTPDAASREEVRQIQAHQPPHNVRHTDRDPQLKRNQPEVVAS